MKPVLSVIVPAYNEEKYIASCLQSLLHQQTRIPYEIIVVDNNSTDKTDRILRGFPVRIIHEKRQGRSHAKNAGLRAASGPLLAFTEADCIVPPTWIQTIHNLFSSKPWVIGVTGGIRFISPRTLIERSGPYMFYIGNALYRIIIRNNTLRGTSFAIRKSVVSKIGLFSARASPLDDLDYGFRAAKIGPILYTDSLTVATDARRIRGRVFAYIREYITAYTKLFVLRQPGQDRWFGNIRT